MFLNDVDSLDGKIALITGAGGFGIGTASAIALAKRGAKVYLNGMNHTNLVEVANHIQEIHGHCAISLGNISVESEVIRMTNEILSVEGKIDILINNAARGSQNCRVDRFPTPEWNDDISIILNGAFYCVRACVPSMINDHWGKIIFISSSAATRGTWGRGLSYAAAKAGLHGMTKQLALELAEFNINVNAIVPTQILTPRVLKGDRRTKESIQEYAKRYIPLKRPGTPKDVADLVVFLSGDESSYLTGQIINLDGGSSLASSATLTLQQNLNE